MTTLSNGTTTLTPTIVDGFQAGRQVKTISHNIIGRDENDYSFRPPGLRKGVLSLVFASESASFAAELALAAPAVWTLADPDRASLAMSFVVADGGLLGRDLDPETRDVWIVSVPFEEVTP